jgi:hypothetical protein
MSTRAPAAAAGPFDFDAALANGLSFSAASITLPCGAIETGAFESLGAPEAPDPRRHPAVISATAAPQATR